MTLNQFISIERAKDCDGLRDIGFELQCLGQTLQDELSIIDTTCAILSTDDKAIEFLRKMIEVLDNN